MAVNTLETRQMNNRLRYLHFLCPILEIRECSECAKCAAELYLQGAPQPALPLAALPRELRARSRSPRRD
jgi:hypothetical protein